MATKMKTTWDLSLFYKSVKDPQIEKDQKLADAAYAAFARKYSKDKTFLKDPKALKKALLQYEKLSELPSSNASFYAYFRKDLNSEDKEAEALLAKLEDRGTKRANQILFFTIELGKVSKTTQEKFLKAKELEPFWYLLKQVFEEAKHTLSEKEEKILMLKSDVSYGRWIQATENSLNKQTVSFKGKELPLPQAEMSLQDMKTTDRRKLYGAIRDKYKSVSDIAESEINAIYTNKKIDDELRGYKTPYEATIQAYENEEKSVMALLAAVEKGNTIAQRFYKAKAKLMGLSELTYADRSASVGKISKKILFSEAVKEVREVFGSLDPQYADIVDRLIKNGQVDVYPKKGKGGGAYCAHGINLPTVVFLNHVDTFESLKTLAHEMGHAVHSERSKDQRPFYEEYSTTTAETASTFFEYAAMKHVISRLTEKEKIIALHNTIQDDISTVFRQIAFFNFEKSLHEKVRSDGYVPKEAIAQLMNQAVGGYMGNAVTLRPDDGYFFVTLSHMRRFFYVYSYAYGQLVSKALHRKLEKNASFITDIDSFLTAGGSKSPEDIFAGIGVNTRTPKVFEEGLASIEEDVKSLEKLVR